MSKSVEELRSAWVAALRSGDYKQGCHELMTPDGGYCCLGVAGKVIGISDEDLSLKGRHNTYQVIQGAYGMQTELGYYSGSALFIHNDLDNWTFDQIADLIESKPEGLFID